MNKPLYSKAGLTEKMLAVRELCEKDLKAFVALVAPQRVLGHCHLDLLDLLMDSDTKAQLVLWPRGHQKSTMLAYWCAWWVVKNPDTTILYASDSLRLAQYQLTIIKNILSSDIVQRYWSGLVIPEESKREIWRQDAIAVDHWKRKAEAVRDPTIVAVGMGANITGSHVDVVILDDIVVYENSATPEERAKSKTWYSLLSSILNPGGIIKSIGTRYHPKDLYQDLIDMAEPIFDDTGDEIDRVAIYEVSEKVCEIDGQFLWPRTRRPDGKWFGFDNQVLARIKASYLDKAQFFAQYYNNPTDPEGATSTDFQYYNKELLKFDGDYWYIYPESNDPISNGTEWLFGKRRLNVFAAIDFASTVTKKSDYTCICVIGIDEAHNIFILDINRFKTDKISVMQENLENMYTKWRWIKLRGEATAAQNLVVQQIKEFNKKRGIFYTIDIFKPTIDKITRIKTNLEPRYSAKVIFHYRGGNCELLEHELQSDRPPHDDIKDSLAMSVEVAYPPVKTRRLNQVSNISYHPRFGGIS